MNILLLVDHSVQFIESVSVTLIRCESVRPPVLFNRLGIIASAMLEIHSRKSCCFENAL